MSLHSESGLTESELQAVDQPLRSRIVERLARIKGLNLLRVDNRMHRDATRLDAKARAAYRKLGINVPDDPDDENVLGDKVTTTNNLGLGAAAVLGAAILGSTAMISRPWEATSPKESSEVARPEFKDTDTDTQLEVYIPDEVDDE